MSTENFNHEDAPIRVRDKRVQCPKCNCTEIAYVRYGSSRAWTRFDGGCEVSSQKPKYMCLRKDCDHRFGELGSPEERYRPGETLTEPPGDKQGEGKQ